jgi:hypothetical protein
VTYVKIRVKTLKTRKNPRKTRDSLHVSGNYRLNLSKETRRLSLVLRDISIEVNQGTFLMRFDSPAF